MKRTLSNEKAEKLVFYFNIWDYVDIEQINEELDTHLEEGVATDIIYKTLDISKDGEIKIEATFTKEEY
jgi:hypothetical protein